MWAGGVRQVQHQTVELPNHGIWVPGPCLWFLFWVHQGWRPYLPGNLSWRQTQHFTHVHGHLQRANGDLWERPDCEDLGHDTSSWLQPCHRVLFPLISSVAGLCTLCTAICTEWMEPSSRILLQTLVAWFSSCCCSRMDSHPCRAQLFCWAPRESPWCWSAVPQPLGLT